MCDPVQSLAYATIMGYCTTISAVHYDFGDGPSASNYQVLHTLMSRKNHGLRIENDLVISQGARSPAQDPLELMPRTSLRDLWVYMAFLIQLAPGHRGSSLQASPIDPSH